MLIEIPIFNVDKKKMKKIYIFMRNGKGLERGEVYMYNTRIFSGKGVGLFLIACVCVVLFQVSFWANYTSFVNLLNVPQASRSDF